jgi:molybdopterin-guanine dinucleotide biosynthesis protein A
MGRDKALLCYHDVPQALWTYRLLQQVCQEVFVGCRTEQDLGPANDLPRICDRMPERGPAEGISAALAHDPAAAWLVVACDLPRLSLEALRDLLRDRDPSALATAFRSAHDSLPEPLCAIYEPQMWPLLEAALDQPHNCPRRLLIEAGERVRLLAARIDGALDNINTPDEAADLQISFPNRPT